MEDSDAKKIEFMLIITILPDFFEFLCTQAMREATY